MKDDTIYRQAATQIALDFIVEYLGGAFDEYFQKKLMERMNALPSAPPEVKVLRVPYTEKPTDIFDALTEEEKRQNKWYAEGYGDAMKELSVQPGITLESAIDYLHSIGWMQEHDRTLTESVQSENQKGEWKECGTITIEGYRAGLKECSKCHSTIVGFGNFCPVCGADMRGE